MCLITILSIITLHCNYGNAIGIEDFRIADDLLKLERRYFMSQSDSERTAISFSKLQLLLKNQVGLNDECLTETARIDPTFLSPEGLQNFYWNNALLMLHNSNFAASADNLYAYHQITQDTSIQYQLMDILVRSFSPYDTLDSGKYDEQVSSILECIQGEKYMSTKSNTDFNWCSYIIPGSGLALKGYYIRGTTALTLNTLSTLLVYNLFRNSLFINAGSYTLLALAKFYQGNIILTRKMISKKELSKRQIQMKTCHQKLNVLLSTHPLMFKLN